MPYDEERCIYYCTLSCHVFIFFWEQYLAIRQDLVYDEAVQMPEKVKGIMAPETFEKARNYNREANLFGMVKLTCTFTLTFMMLFAGGLPFFWKTAGEMARQHIGQSEMAQTVAFLLLLNTFTALSLSPFDAYHTFVLEEKYGFNRQTLGFFSIDQIMQFLAIQMLVLPISLAFVWIIRLGWSNSSLYLWMFVILCTFMLLIIIPSVLPMFDKYSPLPEGPLRTRIKELADSVGFPLTDIYIIEGSKRSGHSNAFFVGIFNNKRIVLFDTLLQDSYSSERKGCNDDEVLAILGHELGHWKLNHVSKMMCLMLVNSLILFIVFEWLISYQAMYAAFGFYGEDPVIVGMILIQMMLAPYNEIIGFCMTLVSRHLEFEADKFACNLGMAQHLRSALIKLYIDNLQCPVNDWLFSCCHYSHPPLFERLAYIKKNE